MLSAHPAKLPARVARPPDILPFSSARAFLMVSKVRKRTPALNAVPYCEISSSFGFRHPGVEKGTATNHHEGRASSIETRDPFSP
jgi:hypothetical protein